MSEDQFARAVAILAETLAERAGSVEGDSPSTNLVIRRVRE
jgi:hypothetical protein